MGKVHKFMEALDVALEFAANKEQPAQMKQAIFYD
jgi:hypothetical protein